jgi:hypothetical protein
MKLQELQELYYQARDPGCVNSDPETVLQAAKVLLEEVIDDGVTDSINDLNPEFIQVMISLVAMSAFECAKLKQNGTKFPKRGEMVLEPKVQVVHQRSPGMVVVKEYVMAPPKKMPPEYWEQQRIEDEAELAEQLALYGRDAEGNIIGHFSFDEGECDDGEVQFYTGYEEDHADDSAPGLVYDAVEAILNKEFDKKQIEVGAAESLHIISFDPKVETEKEIKSRISKVFIKNGWTGRNFGEVWGRLR